MPIIGLTDRPGAGFERIAKLYKGGEKQTRTRKNGEEYQIFGKDLEHFRIEFEPQYEHLRPVWEALYGTEPDEFNGVFLTAQTTDEAFQAWKEEWNSSQTLIHRCDGENQLRWYNADAGVMMSAKKTCEAHTDHPCECKEVGRLDFVFPDFCNEAGVLGIITLTTHSIYDIMTIYARLKMLENINGSLIGVPLLFGRTPREINVPGKDKQGNPTRIKVTKSLIYINPTADFTQRRLIPTLAGAIAPAATPALAATGTDSGQQTDRIRTLLGTGNAQRRMALEPQLSLLEPVDPYANLRSALQEVDIEITIEPRETPGTIHVVLNREVTDQIAFSGWLEERFGKDSLLSVSSGWFDMKWPVTSAKEEA